MTDTTLLYVGIFCFAMMLLGLALTVYEFGKFQGPRRRRDKAEPQSAPQPHRAPLATDRAR